MEDVGLKIQGVIGMALVIGAAWLCSENRRAVKPRHLVFGLGLQFVFALIVLKTQLGRDFFEGANTAILRLLDFAAEGGAFVFGGLADPGGPAGYNFFFQTLVSIIFFASLMSLLYHLGLMQLVVKAVAWVVRRSMKTSGAETLSASANIFVGQTEAPLVVRPFLSRMTRSELMAVMTGGFATVAGAVMAAYVGMLVGVFPDIAGHLMAASVMAAPVGLMMAKILVPETGQSETASASDVKVEKTTANAVDAAASGASDGMKLVLNVAAMLFAFVALVALFNAILGWLGAQFLGTPELSIEWVLEKLLWPVAAAMGIPFEEAGTVSRLLGQKMVLTEFYAFGELAKQAENLSPRSFTMASYALCGFANLASIAIQIGGISAMAPERRADLARLGPKAMIAGFLTTCLTATTAGLLV